MNDIFRDLHPVHYLPILTTLFSIYFLIDIGGRYLKKGGRHLMWWAIGVFTYGLGTFFEGWITLFGNTVFLNKAWYVAGAILGGYPLAQGSVYLHFSQANCEYSDSLFVALHHLQRNHCLFVPSRPVASANFPSERRLT